jgi:hypothetical protein
MGVAVLVIVAGLLTGPSHAGEVPPEPGGAWEIVMGPTIRVIRDGRFETTDGGATWRPIQIEVPPAIPAGATQPPDRTVSETSATSTSTSAPQPPPPPPREDPNSGTQLAHGTRALVKSWPEDMNRGRHLFAGESAVPAESNVFAANAYVLTTGGQAFVIPDFSFTPDGHWEFSAGVLVTPAYQGVLHASVTTSHALAPWFGLGGTMRFGYDLVHEVNINDFVLNGSFGNRDANATLSVGADLVDGLMWNPIVTIAGMSRVSKHVALVTENTRGVTLGEGWYDAIDYLSSAWAVRMFMRHLSLDVGANAVLSEAPIAGDSTLLVFPTVNASVQIRTKRLDP